MPQFKMSTLSKEGGSIQAMPKIGKWKTSLKRHRELISMKLWKLNKTYLTRKIQNWKTENVFSAKGSLIQSCTSQTLKNKIWLF